MEIDISTIIWKEGELKEYCTINGYHWEKHQLGVMYLCVLCVYVWGGVCLGLCVWGGGLCKRAGGGYVWDVSGCVYRGGGVCVMGPGVCVDVFYVLYVWGVWVGCMQAGLVCGMCRAVYGWECLCDRCGVCEWVCFMFFFFFFRQVTDHH